MAILNYANQLNASRQGALSGMLQTAGNLQGLRFNEENMQRQRDQDTAQQQQAQQQQALQAEAQEVFARNDVNEIASFSVANPALGKQMLASKGIVDDAGQQRVSNRFANILTSANPQEALVREIQQGEAAGVDMTQSKEILSQGLSPEGIKRSAGMALASIDGQRFKDIQSSFDGADKKDKPAGLVEFESTIADFTPEQKRDAKLIKAGLKGRAMSNALLSAIQSGDVTNLAEARAQIKQAEKFGELTGSSRARAIDKGLDKIQKIDIGIQNIDKAIDLLGEGAGVGAIERYIPSIKASTVALNNLQSTMALDVIGAVTFGALSQGELDLAKNVALNTKLDTPDLIADLQVRKAAQEKLRSYFNEQIQFLDQGGTVAGFLRSKERGQIQQQEQAQKQPAQQEGNQDQQALQWAQSNPNDPRSAQILNKLGVR